MPESICFRCTLGDSFRYWENEEEEEEPEMYLRQTYAGVPSLCC